MICLVDFGGQTAHLISRRIRELGCPVSIVEPEKITSAILKKSSGIIFSGGPDSVYAKDAPKVAKSIYSSDKPILGICYGFQLMCHDLGGKVIGGQKEYGPATLEIKIGHSNLKIDKAPYSSKKILNAFPTKSIVWMSHGDEVVTLPPGFKTYGSSESVPFAFVGDEGKKMYGLQFHPEVDHTEFGREILKNFIEICGIEVSAHSLDVETLVEKIQMQVGEGYVIGAVSGGVDSTVAASLTAKAIGKRFIPIYVDNGLMRFDTTKHVQNVFSHLKSGVDIVDVRREMLQKLQGVSDPEEKRKIIGAFYIEVFEREMKKLEKKGVKITFLMQGTIYSDVIESQGSRHAANIKSHHNVGGLPKKMKLKLLEPLRELYKDEVRELGALLGLPHEFVFQQPFPGPGYGIRIRGEITAERLKMEEKADRIVVEELKKAGLFEKVFQSFPVLTGAHSTAVKGDGRLFGEVVALRVIESKDVMTSTWARLPYDVLQVISSRIVNEVPDVSRVVYDISTKPPATMEWE